ncbi:MAG: quinol oxidase [Pseudomonadota bacterium]
MLVRGRKMKCLACFAFLMLAVGPLRADPPIPVEPYVAAIGKDGVQRVRVVGGGYFFRPDRIVAKANVPVELAVSLEEAGIVPHTFVLQMPDQGITIDEAMGAEIKLVRFTIGTPGKYPFYCRNQLLFFKSHRERGMEGILEIVE